MVDLIDIPPSEMTKEQLAEFYSQISYKFEELKASIDEIKVSLFDKMKADSEIIGDYIVSKRKRLSFKEVTLEQAGELGATKVVVDTTALNKMHKQGVEMPVEPSVTEYIVIKNKE